MRTAPRACRLLPGPRSASRTCWRNARNNRSNGRLSGRPLSFWGGRRSAATRGLAVNRLDEIRRGQGGNWFAHTVPTQGVCRNYRKPTYRCSSTVGAKMKRRRRTARNRNRQRSGLARETAEAVGKRAAGLRSRVTRGARLVPGGLW